MKPLTVEERFPVPSVRRSIEQSRDLSGYMVWPTDLEAQVNAAVDEVRGLCWASTPGPGKSPTWLSCLLPINHDGDCGWERPLVTRLGRGGAT